MQGCLGYAILKNPPLLSSGKFLSLSISWCPWSHLGVDFIMDLPSSDWYTCIVVILNRFSKTCSLIPLRGLPTTMETAELMFNHVFCILASQRTLFQTMGHNLSPRSIKHSEFVRKLHISCKPSAKVTRTPGTDSLPGPSKPKTPFINQLLGSHPSSASLVCSLLCTRGPDVPSFIHWFQKSERVWDTVHHHLQKTLHHQKGHTDVRWIEIATYLPGKKVWLSTKDIKLHLPTNS